MKLRCYSENKTVFLSVFYDLVLRSSSGVSLVNDTTTISASVYYSNDNELVNFDNSCFTWYNDGYDSVFKTGKSFQLSKADFASDSLTLKCTFNHPESSYQRSEYITITKASNGYSRAVIQLFKRSASKPSNYDGDVLEYTFSTNEISGSTGTWSKTIPSGEYPLYVVYATAFSNASKDTISTGEWTPPAILAEHGTDGSPGPTTFSLVLYQRKASAPDKPTGNVTYNIKSGAVSGAGSWTKEFPNGSDPCWVISATASTYTDSDEITPSEWSSVQKLVENGKNGADAKLIRLSADKTIFSLDSNGRPYAGQVATVTVDKQGIADTHRITGTVSAPDNATEFKVTPQMMGLNPIELTNLLGDGYADNVSVTNTWSSTATFNGFYKSSVSSAKTLLGGHIYYCKIDFEYVSSTLSTLGLHSCYPLYLANASRRRDFSAIYAGESKTIGNITKPTTDSSSQYNYYFYFTEGFAGQTVNLKINRSIYDITNLVSSSPKLQAMTDVELQTWCETYIPIVGANSTWTIGGKAEQMLKQMELDGTNSSAFQRLQNVTYNSNGITFPNDTVDSYYFANYKQTIKAGTVIYSALNQTAYSAGYLYANINNTQRIYEPRAKIGRISCIYPLNKDQTALTVDDGTSSPPSVMTINKQMAIDLTTSGWLAQLSLMGIETDEAIKNWIDTYIPFFDGELDFPRFPSIEIKATAGSYTDYLTIGTQIQPRTLRLSSSPISIELDAEGHSDEEVTVTAHTQNIYGDIFWSNDRGLPVAKGNEQRFRASQLGLKPITLTRLDKEYLYAYYGSNTMSNGIYTFT